MDRHILVQYLDSYLQVEAVQDYGPQGLQVEADTPTVDKIALAVDVAPPIIDAAADWGADMLLVHHGIFWGGPQRIAGPLGDRVRRLLLHDIHLYAAHLALDAHPEVGNNAVLARLLNVTIDNWWFDAKGTKIAVVGPVAEPLSVGSLVSRVEAALHCSARVLKHGPDHVERVAILSGGGAGGVEEAKAMGADTYITGETSHAHYWAAADSGMNVIFAGHYATETVGVQALGQHLAERFGVETRFFDFPTLM